MEMGCVGYVGGGRVIDTKTTMAQQPLKDTRKQQITKIEKRIFKGCSPSCSTPPKNLTQRSTVPFLNPASANPAIQARSIASGHNTTYAQTFHRHISTCTR